MSPKAQRRAIAEACGWKEIGVSGIYQNLAKGINGCMPNEEVHTLRVKMRLPGANSFLVPDYLNDLNAMHEAEGVLADRGKRGEYALMLSSVLSGVATHIQWPAVMATADKRAEAFLKTLDLWKP